MSKKSRITLARTSSETPVVQETQVNEAPRVLDDLSQTAAAVAPAAVAAPKEKPITKKQRVIDMCTNGGCTVDGIAAALGIGKTAARSLIGDVRHAGITVHQANGVYTIAAK